MDADEDDLALLVEAVEAGGAEALRRPGPDVRTWNKADGSPVSDADLAVNGLLRGRLTAARPDYGWLSEEDGPASGASARTFVVDPIDGTRAFLRGETAWTVVATVIEDGRPVAAAILRPAYGTLYTARRDGGARRNGQPIAVSARCQLPGARVAMPGAVYRDAGLREAGVSRADNVASLALRLAKVASGRLDAVLTKPGPHHWDLAAADLIVHEAGGTLGGLDGRTLDYAAPATAHGPTVAGPAALVAALRAHAAEHVG